MCFSLPQFCLVDTPTIAGVTNGFRKQTSCASIPRPPPSLLPTLLAAHGRGRGDPSLRAKDKPLQFLFPLLPEVGIRNLQQQPPSSNQAARGGTGGLRDGAYGRGGLR